MIGAIGGSNGVLRTCGKEGQYVFKALQFKMFGLREDKKSGDRYQWKGMEQTFYI